MKTPKFKVGDLVWVYDASTDTATQTSIVSIDITSDEYLVLRLSEECYTYAGHEVFSTFDDMLKFRSKLK